MTATADVPTVDRDDTDVDETESLRGRLRSRVDTFLARPYSSLQTLLLASVGLLVFGVLMAVSTSISAARDNGGTGSIWGQAVKEAEFIVLGLVIFGLALRMRPAAFRRLAYPLVAIALVALLAVLVPGVGVQAYGAQRWIDLGPMQVQPSELAKVAMLLWGADLLARKQQLGMLTRARHLFVPLVPGFALVALFVMAEPDLGTTCCVMLILLGLLWTIGMPLRYFAVVVAAIAGGVAVLAITEPYRLARLTSFTDPFAHARGSGMQAVEGLYALASGGVFGVGLGHGTSQWGWVANANSDFVFAIIGEELGLLGCLAVLVLFALLAFAGMRISRRNADPFVRLAAGAATIWLCGQAVINIGYVSGLLPVTGIPLPMISAGGTSLLMTFFVLGMLASFARHEPTATNVARRNHRLGRRSRLERLLRVPVPAPYRAPARRTRPTTSSRRGAPAGRNTASYGRAGSSRSGGSGNRDTASYSRAGSLRSGGSGKRDTASYSRAGSSRSGGSGNRDTASYSRAGSLRSGGSENRDTASYAGRAASARSGGPASRNTTSHARAGSARDTGAARNTASHNRTTISVRPAAPRQQSDRRQPERWQSDRRQPEGRQAHWQQSDGQQSDGQQSDGRQSDGQQSDRRQPRERPRRSGTHG